MHDKAARQLAINKIRCEYDLRIMEMEEGT